jgi:hypothetical protein
MRQPAPPTNRARIDGWPRAEAANTAALGSSLPGAGTAALVLGPSIFLPLPPTTRSRRWPPPAMRGDRFYDWLLAQRTFGPIIHEWQRHRSIPYKTKITAVVLMSLTLSTSIVFFVEPLWLKGLLAVMGVGLAVWLYRMPSRDRPPR